MKYLLLVVLSTAIALILEVISLSHYVEPFRPHFLLMVVIFWSLYAQKSYCIGSAWITGIFMDISLNYLVGLHGIIFTLTCFLIKKNKRWLNKLTVIEQSVILTSLYLILILVVLLVNNILQTPNPFGYWRLFSILTSIAIWPLVYALLLETCYYFRIQIR